MHIPGANGGALFGGTAAEPRTGAVYVITQDNPGILRLLRPGENVGRGGGGGGAATPGQLLYQQNCQVCHGPNREGTDNGVPLIYGAADPANNIAAGAPRFTAATIRAVVQAGKNRMPALPHLSGADLDALVQYLTATPGARGGGGRARGRGAGPAASGAPPELIAGSGSAWTRPAAPGAGARGGGRGTPPYPDGVPQFERYVIDSYGTIGNGAKPPFTTIVKYDLNEPAIKWRVGFGDDPALVGRGVVGTGVTQMRNSIIVTESGLVFGAGRDNHIRAWDSETGRATLVVAVRRQLHRLARDVRDGGPTVPAGSCGQRRQDGRGAGAAAAVPAGGAPQGVAATTAPMGWIAYTLPVR